MRINRFPRPIKIRVLPFGLMKMLNLVAILVALCAHGKALAQSEPSKTDLVPQASAPSREASPYFICLSRRRTPDFNRVR